MRREKKRIRKMKYYNIIFSVSCGILLMSGIIIVFAYMGVRTDLPQFILSAVPGLSAAFGGILSGYLYGKQKRHKGIANGMLCGVLIYAAALIFGIFYLKKLPPLSFSVYLLILCPAGAVGGIYGVNSRIRKPPL